MNEPAVFIDARRHTMPLDVRHDGEGQPTDHREIHNVYGLLMTRVHLRGAGAAAARRAALRAHARHLRRRAALRRALAGRQRRPTGTHFRATIPMFANLGLSGLPLRGRGHRRLRGGADAGAVHALAAGRRVLPVHAHAHHLRHARPGALVLRPAPRGDQPPRDRAALPAAAPHLQRDGGGEPHRACPPSGRCSSSTPTTRRPTSATTSSCSGRDLLVAPVLREGVTRARGLPAQGRLVRLLDRRPRRRGRPLRSACPVTLDTHPRLRARRRVRVPPAGRAAHGRDAGAAAGLLVYRRRPPRRRGVALRGRRAQSLAHQRGAFDAAPLRAAARRRLGRCDPAGGAPEGSYRPRRARPDRRSARHGRAGRSRSARRRWPAWTRRGLVGRRGPRLAAHGGGGARWCAPRDRFERPSRSRDVPLAGSIPEV